MSTPVGIAVLGSTGSIGDSTLDVVARHPDRFNIVALGARRDHEKLLAQCLKFEPECAALVEPEAARELEQALRQAGSKTRVLAGEAALDEIAAMPSAPFVMAGIVGAAGLSSSLAAARAGKRLMIANKEPLVMAGPMLIEAAREGRQRCCRSTANTTRSSSVGLRGLRRAAPRRACAAFCSPPRADPLSTGVPSRLPQRRRSRPAVIRAG